MLGHLAVRYVGYVRTVPVRDVLVSNTRGNIEHDDTALAVDVVSVTKAAELLLTSSVPDIEDNLTQVLTLMSELFIALGS